MSNATATAHHAEGVDAQGNLRFYVPTEHHPKNGTLLGFWIYLMSDCLIFAALFAVDAVVGRNYAAGPSGADLFDRHAAAVVDHLRLRHARDGQEA